MTEPTTSIGGAALDGPADRLPLASGYGIPVVGLGVFKAEAGGETQAAVEAAIEAGYRHIDTAAVYGNEADVGAAIAASGVDRDELFITTKLWNEDQGEDSTRAAFERSCTLLGLDRLDLYLLHWPVPDKRIESWRVLEDLYDEGLVDSIGVSNFLDRHLNELVATCNVPPHVNQIELHPFNWLTRADTVQCCRQLGITIEAYSPLVKGRRMDDPALISVAARHGKTPAHVLLRWGIQHGLVVLPKSVKAERIAANADIFDFELDDADMSLLDSLDDGTVATGWNPDVVL